jgi:hypothetical protein
MGKEDWDMEEEDDLIDGCPFVVLQDSPSDVFYFLSALYDGMYVDSHYFSILII